jgi:hypothetical protein
MAISKCGPGINLLNDTPYKKENCLEKRHWGLHEEEAKAREKFGFIFWKNICPACISDLEFRFIRYL